MELLPLVPSRRGIPRLASGAMGIYLALLGTAAALLPSSLLLARHLWGSAPVRCGICDDKVRPWAVQQETFTCRPCEKVLPRRLSYTASAPVGHPKWRTGPSSVPVLATAGRHRR